MTGSIFIGHCSFTISAN
uniref:Uncharacterized protein n=1 Tax=Arundo donax TaxID=35708 RepID=A0A0A9B3W0_ARUDO